MGKTCLKCSHINPAPSGKAMEACPACGAIYTKVEYVLAQREQARAAQQAAKEAAEAKQAQKAAKAQAAQKAAEVKRANKAAKAELARKKGHLPTWQVLSALAATVPLMWWFSERDFAAKTAKARAAAECKHDLQCLGDSASIAAAPSCKRAVEAYAKYSAKWTDGALEPKFPSFRWLDKQSSKLTLIGDHVQFQNGFGAYSNMVYECDVDMSGNLPVVLGARVAHGRMLE